MARNKILPLFVPHGGCPHRCVFCDQRQITGCDHLPSESELFEMLPQDLSADTELAFYGGSFTALRDAVRKRYLSFARDLKRAGRIGAIRISTHPAYVDEDVIAELLAYGVDTVELGIQSTDEEVLTLAKRGHGREEIFRAAALLSASPLKWGVQLMVGLPGDTVEKDLRSVAELLPYHPDMARIYPVLVLDHTELGTMYRQNQYAPLSVAEAVAVSGRMFAMFCYASVQVIRMGLQPTEEIASESDALLAGPFHPSFGYLVKSALKREQIAMVLKSRSEGALRILAPKKELPLVFGDHSQNLSLIAEGRDLAVSEGDLPLGTIALVPYDKKKKHEILSVLTWEDFIENYTEQDRSIYCF
ncbi:MAG: radical SAM protein [Firmicutes bacterium]|nr:radical SAM protein [Bacillota bacterium]